MRNKISPLIVIALLLAPMIAHAASFNVGATVCTPNWYCTSWSGDDCGTRTCTDINLCGSTYGKPTEHISCSNGAGSGGGGGGGSGGSTGTTTENTNPNFPTGHFTLNYENIKLSMEQDQVVQRIIVINSSKPARYDLEIKYPPSYTGNIELVTTTSGSKNIEEIGDFNVIIDTRGSALGTYVIPLTISNDEKSRTISLVIDIVPDKNAIKSMQIDSTVKTIGVDKEVAVSIDTKSEDITVGDKITYSIIDPKGNTLYTSESNVENDGNIRETVKIPTDLEEGYYTLSAKIQTANGEYVSSQQFTLLTPERYHPVLQMPKGTNINWIIAGVAVFIVIAIVLKNSVIFSSSSRGRRLRSEMKWRKETMKDKIKEMGRKIKNIARKMVGRAPVSTQGNAELLKQSYEKGYISKKEYDHALVQEGYHVNSASESKPEHHAHHESTHHEHEPKHEAVHHEAHHAEHREEHKPEHAHHEKAEEKESEKEEKRELKEKKPEPREEPRREEPKPEPKKSSIDKRTHDAFVLNNGEKLNSVKDLLDMLPNMPEYVYAHHTSNGRNDFANWIGDVFQYTDIAEDVRKAKSKEDMIKVLKGYE